MGSQRNGLGLLSAQVRVPDSVIYRSFARETVVLNLTTGQYHGLNPTASTMLDALSEERSVAEAAQKLADEYKRPTVEIEKDLCNLCDSLLQRGLLEITAADAG